MGYIGMYVPELRGRVFSRFSDKGVDFGHYGNKEDMDLHSSLELGMFFFFRKSYFLRS